MSHLPMVIRDPVFEEEYGRCADVALLLGVSEDTIRSWIDQGKLAGKRLRGRWYYARLDGPEGVYAVLREREGKAEAEVGATE